MLLRKTLLFIGKIGETIKKNMLGFECLMASKLHSLKTFRNDKAVVRL